jgi:hypothetical protein
MFLINVAFFVELLAKHNKEIDGELTKAHNENGNERKTAEGVVEFLKTAFKATLNFVI